MIIDEIYNYVEKSEELNKNILPMIKNAVIVKAQNVADYIFKENEKEEFDIHKDFPVISGPWKSYIVSWKFPEYTWSKKAGKREVSEHERFESHSLIISDADSLLILCFVIFSGKLLFIGTGLFGVDKNGQAILIAGKIPFLRSITISKEVDNDSIMQCYFDIRIVVLMTNCFCHCKNVRKINNNISDKLIKRRRREEKINVTRYYTLDISPNMTIPSGSLSNDGLLKSLHICRGHFKNFTSEKPLMGKHTGTYWWSMHTKGNADIGEIKKDYNIQTRETPNHGDTKD